MDTQTIVNSLKDLESQNEPPTDETQLTFYGVKQWNDNEFSVLQSSIAKQLKGVKRDMALVIPFGDNRVCIHGNTLKDLVALYPETRFDFEYIPPQPEVRGMVDYYKSDGYYQDEDGVWREKFSLAKQEGVISKATDCRIKLSFTDGKVKNTCHLNNTIENIRHYDGIMYVNLSPDAMPEETQTQKAALQALVVNGVTHVLPSSLRAAMKGEKSVKLADGVFFETADLRKIMKAAILVSFVYNEDKSQAVAIATSKHDGIFVPSKVSSPTPSTYNARKKRDEWQEYGNLEFAIYTAYEPVSQETSSFNILSRGAYLADCFFARHPEYDSEKVRQVTSKIIKGMKALVKPNTPKATIREIDQFEYMGNVIANSRYHREYAGEVTMLYWEDGFSIEFDEVGMKHLEKVNQIMMYRTLNSRWFSQNGTTFTSVNSGGWAETYQKLLTELPQKGFTIAHASTGILDDNGRYQMAEVY